MDILYIFNPENDLALASGLVNYTAPKNARKIRNDLQMLPLWIASDGDCLFADDNIINRDFLFELQQSFSNIPAVSLWNNTQKIQTVKPWGWSSAIWNELRRARIHISNSQLPDFEKIRELAHRKLVIHNAITRDMYCLRSLCFVRHLLMSKGVWTVWGLLF